MPMEMVLRYCVRKTSSSSRRNISGRASQEGTARFVASAQLHLHHKFHVSGLSINPVIHGPPRPKLRMQPVPSLSVRPGLGDQLLTTAVQRNGINCLYVYNHYLDKTNWHASAATLASLMTSDHGHSRESFVAVAGLGYATSRTELFRRLEEALTLTTLEYVDFAMIDCDTTTFCGENADFDVLNDSLEALEALSKDGVLQSYGLRVSVPPYSYHSPPVRSSGALAMIPSYLESVMCEGQMQHADLILYPISPSSAIPASYPMLDPSPDVYQSDEGESFAVHDHHLLVHPYPSFLIPTLPSSPPLLPLPSLL